MIEVFKADLKGLSSSQIMRKYILGAECSAMDNHQHFTLKEKVCAHLKVQFTDVIVVGSGKLGFSIKPAKRFELFGDESDIDIAVVSPVLFEKVWNETFLYKKTGADWPRSESFFKYLSEGWIRPDKLPVSEYFKFTSDWWGFFNELTASKEYGPYKIRAGLYHSMFFLEEYQKICIEQCQGECK